MSTDKTKREQSLSLRRERENRLGLSETAEQREERLQKRRDADRRRRVRLRAENKNEEECLRARRRIGYAQRRSEEAVESREDRLQARRVHDAQRRNESYQTMTFHRDLSGIIYFVVQLFSSLTSSAGHCHKCCVADNSTPKPHCTTHECQTHKARSGSPLRCFTSS